jgi:hypothetical protein
VKSKCRCEELVVDEMSGEVIDAGRLLRGDGRGILDGRVAAKDGLIFASRCTSFVLMEMFEGEGLLEVDFLDGRGKYDETSRPRPVLLLLGDDSLSIVRWCRDESIMSDTASGRSTSRLRTSSTSLRSEARVLARCLSFTFGLEEVVGGDLVAVNASIAASNAISLFVGGALASVSSNLAGVAADGVRVVVAIDFLTG